MKLTTIDVYGTRVVHSPLSDDEIRKALELCSKGECHTSECPVFRSMAEGDECRTLLVKHALKLIQRLTIINEALLNDAVEKKSQIRLLQKTQQPDKNEILGEFVVALKDELKFQKNTAEHFGNLCRADGLQFAAKIADKVLSERIGEN